MSNRLEKKAWYRFIKVIYFGLYAAAVLLVLFVCWTEKPFNSVDDKRSTIWCRDGKVYSNSNFITGLEYLYDGSDNDNRLRVLCRSGYMVNAVAALKYPEAIDKNYSLRLSYKKIGTWQQVFNVGFIGLGVVVFLFEGIRWIFFYIALGKQPEEHNDTA